MMVHAHRATLFPFTIAILAGCAGSQQDLQIDPTIQLTVEFLDGSWNGQEIPVAGRCVECGGSGRSPALRIGGLPTGANEVVVEFNDLRILELAENGGHGTLAVSTRGKDTVILPSVPEETMSIPRGVRSVRPHKCVLFGKRAGAYKAPCGCGQGNEYVAVVLAVKRNGNQSVILARKEIPLGFF